MISLLTFLQYQGRLPRKKGGDINDALFSIKTSNEILDPLRVFVSDKANVKLYVKAVIGEKYNVPTNAVLSTYEKALSYSYPENCVIKPTHMSGEVLFRRDGCAIDFEKIAKWFDINYYDWTREANYKLLKPKIIVEPYIFDGKNCDDYKIFCVDGQPKLIWVDSERETEPRRNLYSTSWSLLPAWICYPQGAEIPPPENLDEMLYIAGELSRGLSFIRVDLYSNGKTALVGELTNCSGDARSRIAPSDYNPVITELLFGTEGFNSDD